MTDLWNPVIPPPLSSTTYFLFLSVHPIYSRLFLPPSKTSFLSVGLFLFLSICCLPPKPVFLNRRQRKTTLSDKMQLISNIHAWFDYTFYYLFFPAVHESSVENQETDIFLSFCTCASAVFASGPRFYVGFDH